MGYTVYINLCVLLLTISTKMTHVETLNSRTSDVTTITAGGQNSQPPSSNYPECPSNVSCDRLAGDCLGELDGCNQTCMYGETVDLFVEPLVQCLGEANHTRPVVCKFCYQLPAADYTCSEKSDCNTIGTYRSRLYEAKCTVKPSVLCLGKRTFYKNKLCQRTNGYSWTTAMLLSVTLGGFGVDRFYLGQWKEGIGKLFSFGGLGVWTLIDVVLIAIEYITPSDGSQYAHRSNFTSNYYETKFYNILS